MKDRFFIKKAYIQKSPGIGTDTHMLRWHRLNFFSHLWDSVKHAFKKQLQTKGIVASRLFLYLIKACISIHMIQIVLLLVDTTFSH